MHIREPFNGISHFVAAIAALIGLIVLIALTPDDVTKRLSLIAYGGSLTLLFAASSAYHSIQGTPERQARLRKLDHSAIFILIAGSYTPLCLNLFTGFWQWGMLSIIWTVAIAGITYKSFRVGKNDWVTMIIYLAAGLFSLSAIGEIIRVMPAPAIAWLAGGGLFYAVGGVIYASKWLDFKPGVFGFHEVWHLFVIAGAFCHYMLMLLYVVPA